MEKRPNLPVRALCFGLGVAVLLTAVVACGRQRTEVREPDAALFCRGPGYGPGSRAYEDCIEERRMTSPTKPPIW